MVIFHTKLRHILFVMCVEDLKHLLKQAEETESIKCISFSEDGLAVNHLPFYNNSFFLCKAEVDQCQNLIMKVLHTYGEATWHIIHLNKSSITIGENVGA